MVFDNSTVTPTNADIAALQKNTTPTIETTSFVGGMNNTSGDGLKINAQYNSSITTTKSLSPGYLIQSIGGGGGRPPLRGSIIKLFILVELDQHQEAEVTLL